MDQSTGMPFNRNWSPWGLAAIIPRRNSPHWFSETNLFPESASASLHCTSSTGICCRLFDPSWNLEASFGKLRSVWKVRSASPDQFDGEFNSGMAQAYAMPWDVMQLSLAQALTISCQFCGVEIAPSEPRDTYGSSFVIKDVAKFNHD